MSAVTSGSGFAGIEGLRRSVREKGVTLSFAGQRSRTRTAIELATPFVLIGASLLLARLWPAETLWQLPVHFLLLLAAQRCFQTIVHDLSHGLLSTCRSTNDLYGNLLAAGFIGSTVGAYRDIHFQHHKHNGSDLDPEFIDFEEIKRRGGLWRHALRYLLGLESIRLFRKYYLPGNDTMRRKRTSLVVALVSKWHIVLCQLLLLGLFTIVSGAEIYLLWVYIAASWSPLLSSLRFLVEHPGKGDCTVSTRSWWVERLYFAPFGFNFHCEHHLWPGIPPYRLRRVHRQLAAYGVYSEYPENINRSYLLSLLQRSGA